MVEMNKCATGTLALAAGVAIGWFAAPTGETSYHPANQGAGQILRQLVEAGNIIDLEQRAITVRAAFADAKAAEMKMLAQSVL